MTTATTTATATVTSRLPRLDPSRPLQDFQERVCSITDQEYLHQLAVEFACSMIDGCDIAVLGVVVDGVDVPLAWVGPDPVDAPPGRPAASYPLYEGGGQSAYLRLFTSTGRLDTAGEERLEVVGPVLALATSLGAVRRDRQDVLLELGGALNVGKAVGMIMVSRRATEDEALRVITRRSQDLHLTLTETAAEYVRIHESYPTHQEV